MALTEANLNRLVDILEVTRRDLELQITFLGSEFTAQVQTDVEAKITEWDAGVGSDFINIHPNTENFGAEKNAERAKDQIRKFLSNLFQRPDWVGGSSGGSYVSSVQRG